MGVFFEVSKYRFIQFIAVGPKNMSHMCQQVQTKPRIRIWTQG